MTAVPDSSPAELAVLLSQLSAQVQRESGPMTRAGSGAPSPSEAMALYFVATRLVELQLQLEENASVAPAAHSARDLAITRDVLEGTHAVLLAALERIESIERIERAEAEDQAPPLRLVAGRRSRQRHQRHPAE